MFLAISKNVLLKIIIFHLNLYRYYFLECGEYYNVMGKFYLLILSIHFKYSWNTALPIGRIAFPFLRPRGSILQMSVTY